MTDNNDFSQFTMTDDERELFEATLALNPHLQETNYTSLFTWCKLAGYLSQIADEMSKDDLRFAAEFRLLSTSLRLNPRIAVSPKADFAQMLAGGDDE